VQQRLCFPGLGLILSQAREVPVELFVKAVETVASCVKDQQDGRLFPQIKDLADVSKKVALAVACNRQDLI
jgi:malic enzyme